MGWFGLPATLEGSLNIQKFNLLEQLSRIYEVEIPLRLAVSGPKLDRIWEILSINVPDIRFKGVLIYTYEGSSEHLKEAEIIDALSTDIAVSFNINLVQSGLVIGSVSYSSTLSPTFYGIPNKTFAITYETPYFSISDSLQNPVRINGEESINLVSHMAIAVPQMKPFIYEYEEGLGESKHTVKKEVTISKEELLWNAFFGNVEELYEPIHKVYTGTHTLGSVILYVTENDRESE